MYAWQKKILKDSTEKLEKAVVQYNHGLITLEEYKDDLFNILYDVLNRLPTDD